MLEGKQGAGAANTGLHLVHQQEPIPLLAQLRQFVHILPLHGEDTALSLEVGGLSGIVESEYGYHIMLRKPLTDSQKETAAGDHLSALLEERMEAASITYSDKLKDIDAGTFYAKYGEILQAEAEANGQTGGEPSEPSGDAGDAGTAPEGGAAE